MAYDFRNLGFFGHWLMFPKDQSFRILAHFQSPRIFGSWLMPSEDQGFFGASALVFRGPKILDPGSRFQRPRIFGSWRMFSEDQGFLGLWLLFSTDQGIQILAYVFRDLGFLNLGICFKKT